MPGENEPRTPVSPDEAVTVHTEPRGRDADHVNGDQISASVVGPSDVAEPRAVERHLLEFLVCPIKKTTLIYDREKQELISPVAMCAFPIRDGVPLLIESCARPLDDRDAWVHRLK